MITTVSVGYLFINEGGWVNIGVGINDRKERGKNMIYFITEVLIGICDEFGKVFLYTGSLIRVSHFAK